MDWMVLAEHLLAQAHIISLAPHLHTPSPPPPPPLPGFEKGWGVGRINIKDHHHQLCENLKKVTPNQGFCCDIIGS